MRGQRCLSVDYLLPLIKRDSLDLRLYVLLWSMATDSGRVGQSGQPLTFSRLVRLLSYAGYHGMPAYKPSIQSLRSAVARLEGVPGDQRFPRLVRSLSTPRGSLIFQLEMGKGQLRLVAPANTADDTARRPAKARRLGIRSLPTSPANTADNTYLDPSFSIEKGVREAEAVDNLSDERKRELMAKAQAELATLRKRGGQSS